MKLYELAKSIRSKNAGPFTLTIDILFEDEETFRRTVAANALNRALIADIYEVPEEQVEHYICEEARAIKFSFPRPVAAGDFGDRDVFGGQFHSPLVNLDVPVER